MEWLIELSTHLGPADPQLQAGIMAFGGSFLGVLAGRLFAKR